MSEFKGTREGESDLIEIAQDELGMVHEQGFNNGLSGVGMEVAVCNGVRNLPCSAQMHLSFLNSAALKVVNCCETLGNIARL